MNTTTPPGRAEKWQRYLADLRAFAAAPVELESQGKLVPVSYTHLTLPTNREV